MNKFLLTSTLILSALGLSAQTSVGFAVGTNYARWAEKIVKEEYAGEEEDYRAMPGLHFSLWLVLPQSESFALQLQPGFVQKGFRELDKSESNSSKRKTKNDLVLSYVELPVFLKYLKPAGKWTFSLEGGPYLAYLMYGKHRKKTRSSDTNSRSVSRRYTDFDLDKAKAARLDAGIQLGAAVAYPVGPGHITANLRYNRGFVNLDKGEDIIAEIFNKGWGWQVGYMLPLQKATANVSP